VGSFSGWPLGQYNVTQARHQSGLQYQSFEPATRLNGSHTYVRSSISLIQTGHSAKWQSYLCHVPRSQSWAKPLSTSLTCPRTSARSGFRGIPIVLIEGQITGHFSTGCSACKLFNAVLLSCRPPAGVTCLILAFVDTRPCYRPTLSAKVLSPQLSGSGTSKGRVRNAFYVHLSGLARPPLCLLAPLSFPGKQMPIRRTAGLALANLLLPS